MLVGTASGHPQPDRHRRVEMTTRYVADRVGDGQHGKTKGEGERLPVLMRALARAWPVPRVREQRRAWPVVLPEERREQPQARRFHLRDTCPRKPFQ